MKNIVIGEKRIGEKIRQARDIKNISQRKLGYKLNLSKQSMYNIEKGIKKVSISELVEIAKATGQPLEFFYEFEEEHQRTYSIKGEVLDKFEGLKPEDIKAVDKIIDKIRAKRKGSKN